MNNKKIFLTLLSLLIITPLISATDIAYIYKSEMKVDSTVLQTFSEMNLSVELIQEKEAKNTNLSNYSFVFLGDERLKKIGNAYENNLLIMNKYSIKEAGISSSSTTKLASNRRYKVLIDSEEKEVYLSDNSPRKSIPYYYIPQKRTIESSKGIASAFTGRNLGQIISYTNSSSELGNGQIAKGNICFFGIIKTEYWNNEAKNLFKNCVDFVKSGEITSNITEENETEENNTNGNLIHDIGLIDFSNSFNKIRLEFPNGTDILEEKPTLKCNEKYKIVLTVKNLGNSTEDVTFNGSIGTLLFNHLPKDGLEPTKTSLKTKTVEMELDAGNYAIEVEAIIPSDDFQENNKASREIEIIC